MLLMVYPSVDKMFASVSETNIHRAESRNNFEIPEKARFIAYHVFSSCHNLSVNVSCSCCALAEKLAN